MDDRIFSTSVDVLYTFAPFEIAAPKDEKKLQFDREQIEGVGGLQGAWEGIQVSESAREITLTIFATDESASVQVCCTSLDRPGVREADPATGDAVQDGAAIDQRERGGGSGDIHAPQQTLHPGRHEIHRGRQHFSVQSPVLSRKTPGADVMLIQGPRGGVRAGRGSKVRRDKRRVRPHR